MDEAQNSTFKEIVTLITRLGNGCKCLVLADPEQTDLTNGKVGGFGKVYKAFDNKESRGQGIHTFEFTDNDIKRSELVKFVVKKLKTVK
jgi:phosphate starvation-inducible protein PhoH